MGRHYPDVVADPVPMRGYWYSPKYRKLARLKLGDKLPRHMGPWEFLAGDDEGSTSEILQRLRDKYPGLDPYRLTYTTSTPVDPKRMASTRKMRKVGYLLSFAGVVALAYLVAGRFPSLARRG